MRGVFRLLTQWGVICFRNEGYSQACMFSFIPLNDDEVESKKTCFE